MTCERGDSCADFEGDVLPSSFLLDQFLLSIILIDTSTYEECNTN